MRISPIPRIVLCFIPAYITLYQLYYRKQIYFENVPSAGSRKESRYFVWLLCLVKVALESTEFLKFIFIFLVCEFYYFLAIFKFLITVPFSTTNC